ncbi:MAG: hypothetical protein KIS85_06660 [Anaerolineales bacterium]|nr:hypothetical protein [Anaerolineales bacterium]
MSAPTIRQCPYCGEEILAAAIKCKHCGEFLNDTHETQSAVTPEPKVVVKEGIFLQSLNFGCIVVIIFAVIIAIMIFLLAIA